MNQQVEILSQDELDFSQLKLLGYYWSETPVLLPEDIYTVEAEHLAELLYASFTAKECEDTLPANLLAEIVSSVLVFKNRTGHLFAYCHKSRSARVTGVKYFKSSITKPDIEYQQFFRPGEPFESFKYQDIIKDKKKDSSPTEVTVPVKRIVTLDYVYYYEVEYLGELCYVRLLPFEISFLDRSREKTELCCIYSGLDTEGRPRLAQSRSALIDELFEEDTVETFHYLESRIDTNSASNAEYHLLRDNYGLKHRFYGILEDFEKVRGAKINFYIKGINNRTNTLVLVKYNPSFNYDKGDWASPDLVFQEIDELDNKEQYFNTLLYPSKHYSKLIKDLIGQCGANSNLWIFTYMNILDEEIVPKCIRKHEVEELITVCNIMIKLQRWMVEGSTFLDRFGEETKNNTILKSTSQIEKYQRILLAVDIIKNDGQHAYIEEIINTIQKSGRLAIRKEERIRTMINILRLYDEFFIENIETTCNLFKALLMLDDGILPSDIVYLTEFLDYYIEHDVRQVRKSTLRSNDIDTSNTLCINEILSLLCIKAMVYSDPKCYDELISRTTKARFFRFLSFLSPLDLQPIVLKAGIDSLVGVLSDNQIFTWENASHIDHLQLCNLTSKATVLDSNLGNDFVYMKESGRSGVVLLDTTGFTIVPYHLCSKYLRTSVTIADDIKTIHRLASLPIKLGTMLDIAEIEMPNDVVEQYVTWQNITKNVSSLPSSEPFKPLPKEGDYVKVIVKEQNQPDTLKHLVFVSVIDSKYNHIDGVIAINDISKKWIPDARTLFRKGDIFYATVSHVSSSGKYAFRIADEVSKYGSSVSPLEEDLRNIVVAQQTNSTYRLLSVDYIQELILLIDMSIRKENNPSDRMTLIGYAHSLCSLVSDPKSYYYDFLQRYYAVVDKFVSGKHTDISINFDDVVNESIIKNISGKKRLAELMSYSQSNSEDGITELQNLAIKESGNDTGKLSAMLVSYFYAQKEHLSNSILQSLHDEINAFVCNPEKLDFAVLVEDKKNNQTTNDFVEENPEIVELEVDNSSSDETESQQIDVKPLRLGIFEDGSLEIVDGDSEMSRVPITEIRIDEWATNGILLLINGDSGIAKFKIEDIEKMPRNEHVSSEINPYKISNIFVVPTDCIIGSLITAPDEKYVVMYNTSEIEDCTFMDPQFLIQAGISVVRHQPFILPGSNTIKGLNKYIGNCVAQTELTDSIVDEMSTYSIFI